MPSCVCKISFKSVQVCGGWCKMFRGLIFLGHSVERRLVQTRRDHGTSMRRNRPHLCSAGDAAEEYHRVILHRLNKAVVSATTTNCHITKIHQRIYN